MRTVHRVLGVSTILGGALALALALPEQVVDAADHVDSPAAIADPASDIADLFAWTSADGSRLNLVMTMVGTTPSDTTQYVFNIASGANLTAVNVPYQILCTFDATGSIECWAGNGAGMEDDYTKGDASAAGGLEGWNGRFTVFAGERNDPFFFNLGGFNEVLSIVKSEADAGNLTFDPAFCPVLDSTTAGTLVAQLSSDPGGGAATDDFAPNSVGALVVSIDRELVTAGGPVVGVWAATYAE